MKQDNVYHAYIPFDTIFPPSFVAIDFETATVSKMACQLGIVNVENGIITNKKEFLIQPPNNQYDIQNIVVHNISPDMTAKAPTFDKLWPEIKDILNQKTIVAHNADFDIDVLRKNIEYYDLPPIKFHQLCTCKLLGYATLTSACKHFGIEIPCHHKAIDDAEACAKLLLKCETLSGKRFDILKVEENTFSSRDLSSEVKQQDLEHCTNKDTIFYDKKVVITGIFEKFLNREELAQRLKNYGADINSSISKKTNIVLIGNGAGPKKLETIEKINSSGIGHIRTIREEELIKLLDEIE